MLELESHFIKGSASIADLFKERERCGIYILTFETGERYVGKTTDVAKRYVQHRRTHKDIDMIQFHCTTEDKLSLIERDVIKTLEAQGYRLRNISLMADPYFQVPEQYRAIDLVMSLEEQEQWLKGESAEEFASERRLSIEQRAKYKSRIDNLEQKKFFPLFSKVLVNYFKIGIPFPEKTEFSSYSVSCLPSSQVYARVNINNMEVFTAFEFEEWFSISLHLAKRELEGSLKQLKQKYPDLVVSDHKYKSGGNDQINLLISDTSDIEPFLLEPDIALAVRTMNMRLMRRGANVYSSSHCPQLVDIALGAAES